jgi:hypothetical protein
MRKWFVLLLADAECPIFSGASRLILAGIVVAFVTAANHSQAAPPLRVVFENDSGHPASGVYVGFVGSNTLTATNVATGAALAVSKNGTPNWYTLDKLPQGIDLYDFSARIYVGYGAPWVFQRDGYEPDPVARSDPNYFKRYDKVEITYSGNPSDVANTTSIDYFSIPIALHAYRGGLDGKPVGSVTASATDEILTALRAVTTPVNAAVVRTAMGDFVRVIGPGKYPPPPGLPSSPYDDFSAYLKYLRDSYAPAHGEAVALVKGHFSGVGQTPTTPETKPQDYDFPAVIDDQLDITLGGSATVVGAHALYLKHADLAAATGIYGANPPFSLDRAPPRAPSNDIYGWLIGDLLAGINIGAVGSTVPQSARVRVESDAGASFAISDILAARARAGDPVIGELPSQEWFKLTSLFSALQPDHDNFYNRYAGALTLVSQAYGFAYSDRFAHPIATLNPNAPDFVDTLLIVFEPEHTSRRR